MTDPAAGFWHGTTILSVRRAGLVVVAGDGQVSLGAIVVKGNARKVRRLGDEGGRGAVLAGFAGATACLADPRVTVSAPAPLAGAETADVGIYRFQGGAALTLSLAGEGDYPGCEGPPPVLRYQLPSSLRIHRADPPVTPSSSWSDSSASVDSEAGAASCATAPSFLSWSVMAILPGFHRDTPLR